MKKLFNFFISTLLITIIAFTILYANNPGFVHDYSAKLSGKRTEEVNIYKDEKGNTKYSSGYCKKDSDCSPSGCSNHICSDDPDLITTCEYRDDYPDILVYACGCVNGFCVWFEK